MESNRWEWYLLPVLSSRTPTDSIQITLDAVGLEERTIGEWNLCQCGMDVLRKRTNVFNVVVRFVNISLSGHQHRRRNLADSSSGFQDLETPKAFSGVNADDDSFVKTQRGLGWKFRIPLKQVTRRSFNQNLSTHNYPEEKRRNFRLLSEKEVNITSKRYRFFVN